MKINTKNDLPTIISLLKKYRKEINTRFIKKDNIISILNSLKELFKNKRILQVIESIKDQIKQVEAERREIAKDILLIFDDLAELIMADINGPPIFKNEYEKLSTTDQDPVVKVFALHRFFLICFKVEASNRHRLERLLYRDDDFANNTIDRAGYKIFKNLQDKLKRLYSLSFSIKHINKFDSSNNNIQKIFMYRTDIQTACDSLIELFSNVNEFKHIKFQYIYFKYYIDKKNKKPKLIITIKSKKHEFSGMRAVLIYELLLNPNDTDDQSCEDALIAAEYKSVSQAALRRQFKDANSSLENIFYDFGIKNIINYNSPDAWVNEKHVPHLKEI